jgi:ABC-2 type transport system permease protein
MSKTISLFKTLFNSWYGISNFKYKASKDKKEVLKFVGLILVIALSILPILIGYILFIDSSYAGLHEFGQAGAIITIGVVISSTVVLIFGIFVVISAFYFTDDTEQLVSMPFKPWQILGAKLGVVLTSEYLTSIPILLPPLIIYGTKTGAGILYYLYSIIALLVVPIIPLCIVSIISMIIMRVVNIGKKKDLLSIIGAILGIFIILGIQVAIQKTASQGDPEKIKALFFSENGLISSIAAAYPPGAWISMALIKYKTLGGLLYLILFLAISSIFIFAFLYFGQKLFFGGLLGLKESEAKRKKVSDRELSNELVSRGKISAVFWKEFKILNRVPSFFVNCALPSFLLPAIFIITFIFAGEESLKELSFLNKGNPILLTLGVVGINVFTIAANMTSPTAISREGNEFYISKYIPVSPKEQLLGKAIHAFVITETGVILTTLSFGFILKMDILYTFIAIIISTIASLSIIEISLIIDLFRPYFNWNNPQKAVKQNLNGVLSMFLNFLWSVLIIFLVGKFIKNSTFAYLTLIISFLVLGIVFYKVLISFGTKRYGEIEN